MARNVRRPMGQLLWMLFVFGMPCGAQPPPSMSRMDSLCLAGEVRLELGGARHAVPLLEEAVKIDTGRATAYARLGSAYLRIGKWEKSEQALRAALALNADLAEALDGLGLIALHEQKDVKVARAYFEAALERAPGSGAIRYHIGLARLLADAPNLGRAAKHALGQDSMDVVACRALAEAYASRDECAQAIRFYKRCLDRDPIDGDAVYRLGLLYTEAGQYDGLGDLLSRLKDRPDERRWLPLTAQVYLHEGDGMRALKVFEDYIRHLDAEEQALYRDISLVASQSELEAYARVSGPEREAFLKRFWNRHDLSLVTGGALRQAEHCRRVWYARTYFSRAIYPWDRRGEVYIRYGEPDYRATSKRLNPIPPPQVQRIKERMAVELYGSDAAEEFYTGPVFPIRSSQAFGVAAPPPDMGLSPEEAQQLVLKNALVTQQGASSDPGVGPNSRADQDRMQEVLIDDAETGRNQSAGVDVGDQGLLPGQVRQEKFADRSMGLFMPVTARENASVVPWESWVYTKIAEGFEVTFTDEYFKGNYDYAPVPTHVPNELKHRYVEVRDVAEFLFHAPEVVMQKMAGRVPDFHDFTRGAQPLDFSYRTASFRGNDGRTRLEVYWGISPDSLLGHKEGVRVERSVSLVDPVFDRVYRSDRELFLTESFLRASADTSRGWQEYIMDAATLEAPPGTYEFGMQVRQRGARRFQLYKQQVALVTYSTTELQLSDVELAWSIAEADGREEGVFVKHGLRVMAMSAWTLPKGHPAFLYFEIYNLTRDALGQTHYQVTYEVRSKSATGRAARVLTGMGRLLGMQQETQKVSVTYDRVSREMQDVSYVELNLDEAGVGDQEVQVTVTDIVSGRSASKTTMFGIR